MPSRGSASSERKFVTSEAFCEACAPHGSSFGGNAKKRATCSRKSPLHQSSPKRRAVRRFHSRRWSAAQVRLLVAGVTIGLASMVMAIALLFVTNGPEELPTVIRQPVDVQQPSADYTSVGRPHADGLLSGRTAGSV